MTISAINVIRTSINRTYLHMFEGEHVEKLYWRPLVLYQLLVYIICKPIFLIATHEKSHWNDRNQLLVSGYLISAVRGR